MSVDLCIVVIEGCICDVLDFFKLGIFFKDIVLLIESLEGF